MTDLFCGAGGLTLGALRAASDGGLDMEVALGVDTDWYSEQVYRRNFPSAGFLRSNVDELVDYSVRPIGAAVWSYMPELMVSAPTNGLVVGGPPCQGHSNLNNKTRRDDPRNGLYIAAVAFAVASNAEGIVFENVPEIASSKGGEIEMARQLLEGHYEVRVETLRAVDFGVAQTRRRSFLLARKRGRSEFGEVVAQHRRPLKTLRDAIGDLENIVPLGEFDRPAQAADVTQDRINFLFENDLYELPDAERPDCHRDGHTYGAVYGRLRWDQPSGTITQGFQTMGRGRFVHPSQPRTLTPHEAARIQGFPDSFCFETLGDFALPRKAYAKLIGNAVPPAMAAVAVSWVLDIT